MKSTTSLETLQFSPPDSVSVQQNTAYQRPRPTAVQIARIAAVTLVAVSFILGFFMVASAYITATATCYQDYPAPQEHQEDRPMFQALVDPLDTEESSHTKRESDEPVSSRGHQQHDSQQSDDAREDQPIQIKLPLQLDFDELAGSMMEKNQRSRMNCVVEKRRAEEVMDHQPKTVRLPFGVNLTTDPRYEHVTGERMAIFCESGNDQSSQPGQLRQWVTEYWTPEGRFETYGPVYRSSGDDDKDSIYKPKELKFDNFIPNRIKRHVPMEQEQNAPMMQMHVVPIQVQQIPLHPNAIPHGPHPMHFHQQAPQQPRSIPHMMAPHMNGPQAPQMAPQMAPHMAPQMAHQMPPHMMQHHQQLPHFRPQVQGPVELPPQVLQAVQQQLAAEEEMAAQQKMAQQNRRFPPQAQIIPDSAEQVFIQEEIIPILQHQAHPRPEGRSMEGHPVLQALEAVEKHPVPAETVEPPPLPGFTRLPIPASDRPHYVQPRSIRDVSSLLKREKRVRRCACDCSC